MKEIIDILTEDLKDLVRDLENINYEVSLDELETKFNRSKDLEELKEEHGLGGLRFFKDKYYSYKYLCIPDKDSKLLGSEDLSHLEILDSHDFHIILSAAAPNIKFVTTGKTYKNLDELKKDYLTLQLAGV